MTTLQDIADRQSHTTMTTEGWVMPPQDQDIIVRIRSKEWIESEARLRGLPAGTGGFTEGRFVFVPPLQTAADIEIWRHEIRHAIEGDWHGREALERAQSCLTARCRERMKGVHPDLVRVIESASRDASAPFFVICGRRTKAEQETLVRLGKSKTMDSRHLTGHAVDLAALEAGTLTWNKAAYETLAVSVKRAALAEGVPITWGGDFRDENGRPWFDGVHFELPRDRYPNG